MQIIEVAAALRFKSGAVLQQALVTFDEHAHPGFFTRSMWRIASGTSGPYVGSKRRFQIPPDRDYHRAFFEMAQHANDGAVYLRVSGERPHYRITKDPRKPWVVHTDDEELFGARLADCYGRWAGLLKARRT